MKKQIDAYLLTLVTTIEQIDTTEIELCAKVLFQAFKDEKKIFVCGNGGSASTVSHFVCDIGKGVNCESGKRFKVLSLVSELATLTAYSNDIDYEVVFVEQLKNLFQRGDVVIGFSGSGNSNNVLNAIKYANGNGGISIGWTGFDGGELKKISHYSVNTNINDMQISEDLHMVFTHLMMRLLNEYVVKFEN